MARLSRRKAALAALCSLPNTSAFTTCHSSLTRIRPSSSLGLSNNNHDSPNPIGSAALIAALSATLAFSPLASFADTAASTAQKYDGFAEYAKENKMEQSALEPPIPLKSH